MRNQRFQIGVFWILCRPANGIHALLFARKQHLIRVHRDDVGFDQLLQAGWSGMCKGNSFALTECQIDRPGQNHQGQDSA